MWHFVGGLFPSPYAATSMREYFAALEEEGEDHLYEAKVLVLGEGGAGKTSLSKKIIDPDYQLKGEEISTEGIDVLEHTFTCDNGESFQANLWDFGGQEIYHATHQFFLTKRSLYLLVADSRKEDTDFNYWLDVSQLSAMGISSRRNIPLAQGKKEKGDKNLGAGYCVSPKSNARCLPSGLHSSGRSIVSAQRQPQRPKG